VEFRHLKALTCLNLGATKVTVAGLKELGGECRMRSAVTCIIGLGLMAAITLVNGLGQPPAAPHPDSQYRLGPDSIQQDGVPHGEIKGPFTLACQVYPGTQHTYWVYVPAQYEPKEPAALMVFQDGQAFKDEKGDMRAQNVMDSLICNRSRYPELSPVLSL
jgi:hypothetical protein